MKSKQLVVSLTALSAVVCSGFAMAGPGMQDGEDFSKGFQSSRSRAEVQRDLINSRNDDPWSNSRGNTEVTDIGPRGASGARYSMRTRDEVRTELEDYRRSSGGKPGSNLYFGD